MAETLKSIRARGDDMPLVLAQLERLGGQRLLDKHFPTHGHGVGLSLGWVTVLWLSHTLSAANPRLNPVEPWAVQRHHTRRGCTGQRVSRRDLSDDRRAAVLEALRAHARWQAFEGAFTPHRRRVYDLQAERVRLDTTTASGSWRVTADGLSQFGHSQGHRPELAQVQSMLSALAPLGLPVATPMVPGQRADDPLSLPAIMRGRESVGRRGLLDVGGCKMGALAPRASLHAGEDRYLCPLSELQVPPGVLATDLAPVWMGDQPLPPSSREQANGRPEVLAEGFERQEHLTAVVGGVPIGGTARRLLIRSHPLAQAGERGVRARLARRRPRWPRSTREGGATRGARSCPRCQPPWKRSCPESGGRGCCRRGTARRNAGSPCGALGTGRPDAAWSGTGKSPSASTRRRWEPRGANWAGGSMRPTPQPSTSRWRRRCWLTAVNTWWRATSAG
jgi:hypothetical protein